MEKNDFLLYNEIIYRIHACRTLEEFRPTLLAQVKLIIPYTYASLIAIQTDPETGELIHRDPYCKPQNFREVENAWLGRIDKAYTAWLSHAPESMVVRDSEILSGDKRFSAASYRELYTAYHVHDCMQMNITYAGQAMGRLALYRTRGDGLFTDQEAFYLRALANHIDLACWTCKQNEDNQPKQTRSLEEIIRTYDLTRREGEVLGLVSGLEQRGDPGKADHQQEHPAQALAESLSKVRGVLQMGPAEAAGLNVYREIPSAPVPVEGTGALYVHKWFGPSGRTPQTASRPLSGEPFHSILLNTSSPARPGRCRHRP